MKNLLLILLAMFVGISVVGCASGMASLNTDTYTKTYKNGRISSIQFKEGDRTLLMFDRGKLVSVSRDATLFGTFKAWLRDVYYYKNGKLIKSEVSKFTFVPSNDGTENVVVVREYSWYKNGLLDRKDGPAFETTAGYKVWYRKGILHREDGPAIITPDGGKVYFNNGMVHRLDGPAKTWNNEDGTLHEEWWIKDVQYSKEEWEIIVWGMNE